MQRIRYMAQRPNEDDISYILENLITRLILDQQRRAQVNLFILEFVSIVLIAQILETERRLYIYNNALQQGYYSDHLSEFERARPGRHSLFSSPQLVQTYDPRDYDLDAAIQASEAEAERSRHAVRPENKFDTIDQMPNNFKVTDDVLENLKQGKLFDPIMQDTTDMNDGEKFACVKLSNNIYQIYKQNDLEKHIKTSGVIHGKFKDINTLESVDLGSVLTLTSEKLRGFANSQQADGVRRHSR